MGIAVRLANKTTRESMQKQVVTNQRILMNTRFKSLGLGVPIERLSVGSVMTWWKIVKLRAGF